MFTLFLKTNNLKKEKKIVLCKLFSSVDIVNAFSSPLAYTSPDSPSLIPTAKVFVYYGCLSSGWSVCSSSHTLLMTSTLLPCGHQLASESGRESWTEETSQQQKEMLASKQHETCRHIKNRWTK